MSPDVVVNLVMQAVTVSLKVALPILLAGLLVGLLVSVFQAITQIQEMTLTFIPKILAAIAVFVIAGPWMLGQLLSYTEQLWASIPGIVS
ncbi:MAG: flagellar biosynthesis protein FliQ [Thermoleophilaceae bacterium]|nr:flagellar biosynthesis protein FliQ [Thermoleophilaceae bacterium]